MSLKIINDFYISFLDGRLVTQKYEEIKLKFLLSLLVTIVAFGSKVFAADVKHAHDWQIDFIKPSSPVMHQFATLHHELLFIVFGVSFFVLALLAYVCFRFRAKNNPKPSTTTHHTLLEIVWTLVPVLILVMIAIPSLRALYYADQVPESDMTLKVIGYQWYWGYEYPDNGDISFVSNLIPDDELKSDQLRLLSVDNPVVLPVDTNIRVQITAADVIHSWAVPALGVKRDAVPGRLNETWLRIEEPGIYYGQCSELCGMRHGFMPIEIKAVSKQEFKDWVEQTKNNQ